MTRTSTSHRMTRIGTRIAAGVICIGLLGATAAVAVGGFDDVPTTHTHADGVVYVSNAGVTAGCDAESYCPDDDLTRGQMATFLYRASGHDPQTPPSVNAAEVGGFTAQELMGDVGPAGPPGPAGTAGYEIVTVAKESINTTVASSSATCPVGKKVLGGGVGTPSFGWYVNESKPVGDNEWLGFMVQASGIAGNVTVTAYAICADVG